MEIFPAHPFVFASDLKYISQEISINFIKNLLQINIKLTTDNSNHDDTLTTIDSILLLS